MLLRHYDLFLLLGAQSVHTVLVRYFIEEKELSWMGTSSYFLFHLFFVLFLTYFHVLLMCK